MKRLALVVLAGCAALEPDVGPPYAGTTCQDDDTDPAASVSFSASIRPLVDRAVGGCSCHQPTATGSGIGTQLSGLDLGSVSALRRGGNSSLQRIVVEGEPCASVLYQKLSPSPPFGSRMPLNGPPYWTAEELTLVHDWIAEGAADD